MIELENNYTETDFDGWRQHWIDTHRASSSAPLRVQFDTTAKTTSAHRVLKSSSTDASRIGRSETTLPIAEHKQQRSVTWQQLHHVSVSEGKMTSPTSDTTSKPQRQRGQDSIDDLEPGKLMGARTNTHSTTSSNLDTIVYANLDTANPRYADLVETGYLHACMRPNSDRSRPVASTSRSRYRVEYEFQHILYI